MSTGAAFRERLSRGALLLDGGLGTMLVARGLPAGAAPESWNALQPRTVWEVHRAYVEAGSEAVHTNTFGGSPARLAARGLEDRCEELNAGGVAIARVSGPVFVVGDIGPTGQHLPPVGRGDLEEWRDGFARQCRALVDAGVDALHVETMSDVREALAALEAALAVAAERPVLVSLTFERKRRGFFTIMGDPLGPSLRRLADAGAAAVGANCTLASGDMAALAREALDLGVPVVVQPNAGAPEVAADGTVRYAQSPEAFADDLAPLAPHLAALGGCCGTDPSFVAALASRLR